MAANRLFRAGPTTVTTTSATVPMNFINPGTATAGTGILPAPAAQYAIVRHIRIINTAASTQLVSMFVGASATGSAATTVIVNSTSIAGNSFIEWYGALRLDNADFLSITNISGASGNLTVEAEGEVGIAG